MTTMTESERAYWNAKGPFVVTRYNRNTCRSVAASGVIDDIEAAHAWIRRRQPEPFGGYFIDKASAHKAKGPKGRSR